MDMTHSIEQSQLAHFFTADKVSAPLWFLARLYLGYEYLMAGWGKLASPAWYGSDAGAALQGFVQGALSKTGGAHPDVYMWYASFLQNTVLPHLVVWSNAVVFGEIAIGLGLIVGLFTRTAAFFAFFMAFNFLLAGTVSVNPVLMLLAICIMVAHRVAGQWGLDRYAKPFLHHLFRRHSH
ncbi:MAG: DoxX family membrane protein [Patescibacteria group bacterium]|nr:DoxX family membrane protein [Patescibacteria group bacterium]